MAALELCPLSTHLEDPEIASIKSELRNADVANVELDEELDPAPLAQNYDDDVFVDFWDQIEANDVACDLYLPLEFEDVLEIDGRRVGSSHALLMVLANIKEDMFLDDEEEEDSEDDEAIDDDELDEFDDYGGGGDDEHFSADDESPIAVKDQQMRGVWRAMNRAAKLSLAQGLALFIHD